MAWALPPARGTASTPRTQPPPPCAKSDVTEPLRKIECSVRGPKVLMVALIGDPAPFRVGAGGKS